MHASVMRLLAAARLARGNPEFSLTEVAGELGVSPQTMTNWKGRRGVSRDGAILAGSLYSVAAEWIRAGTGEGPALPVTVLPAREPGVEPPKPDFHARVVSDSEWATLENMRVLPEEEIASLRQDIESRARRYEDAFARFQARSKAK